MKLLKALISLLALLQDETLAQVRPRTILSTQGRAHHPFTTWSQSQPSIIPEIRLQNQAIMQCKTLQDAKCKFEAMDRPDVVTFYSMLDRCRKEQNLCEMVKYFDLMHDQGMEPNFVMYDVLMEAYLDAKMPQEAMTVYSKAMKLAFTENTKRRMSSLAIRACEQADDWAETRKIVLTMEQDGLINNEFVNNFFNVYAMHLDDPEVASFARYLADNYSSAHAPVRNDAGIPVIEDNGGVSPGILLMQFQDVVQKWAPARVCFNTVDTPNIESLRDSLDKLVSKYLPTYSKRPHFLIGFCYTRKPNQFESTSSQVPANEILFA